jgi:hypothetical protein
VGQTHLRSFFEQLREGRFSSFYLGLVFAEISSGSRFKVIAKICFGFIANFFGRGLPAVLGVPSVVVHTQLAYMQLGVASPTCVKPEQRQAYAFQRSATVPTNQRLGFAFSQHSLVVLALVFNHSDIRPAETPSDHSRAYFQRLRQSTQTFHSMSETTLFTLTILSGIGLDALVLNTPRIWISFKTLY